MNVLVCDKLEPIRPSYSFNETSYWYLIELIPLDSKVACQWVFNQLNLEEQDS